MLITCPISLWREKEYRKSYTELQEADYCLKKKSQDVQFPVMLTNVPKTMSNVKMKGENFKTLPGEYRKEKVNLKIKSYIASFIQCPSWVNFQEVGDVTSGS